jgi:hypothetical protein
MSNTLEKAGTEELCLKFFGPKIGSDIFRFVNGLSPW